MGSNAFGDRLRTSRSLPSMNASQKVRIDLGGHRLRSARADYQLGASRISKGINIGNWLRLLRIDLGGTRLRCARADYQLGASRISKGGKYRKLAPPAGLEPATS